MNKSITYMGTKHTSKCLQKAGDKEPIFVLRGQDVSAPKVILHWIAGNFENVPDDKLREAFEQALAMKGFFYRKEAD